MYAHLLHNDMTFVSRILMPALGLTQNDCAKMEPPTRQAPPWLLVPLERQLPAWS